MDSLQVVALTHKKVDINRLGLLFLDEDNQRNLLPVFKRKFQIQELMVLSTCNRLEFVFIHDKEIDKILFHEFIHFLFPEHSEETISYFVEKSEFFSDEEAAKHLFSVCSGLESMVVGEREIITQLRKSYEFCLSLGITGDTIRIIIQQAIVTAKEIYSSTDIAKNPVSVVSLAYRKLKEFNVPKQARFILVGAGDTISNMAKYLKKHQYANFYIYNRTLSKADQLAKELDGKAFDLDNLKNHRNGFDVLISCTSSASPIITKEIFDSLLNGERSTKIVVDLAVPADVDQSILAQTNVSYVDITLLQEIAKTNLMRREKELVKCQSILEKRITEFKQIYKERALELALSELPKRVKEIRETAVNEVFAKKLQGVDTESRKIIDELMNYMEKKYNAIAMTTAKESLLESKKIKNIF